MFLTVIRASVPKLNLDDAFEQKNEIARAVEEELEKAMSAYGYEIVQTLIVDIEPDEHVKRAMNEINAGTPSNHHSTMLIYHVGVLYLRLELIAFIVTTCRVLWPKN